MESPRDPGPIDNSVLYDQDNHVSSAVWDGQVRQASFIMFPFVFKCSLFEMTTIAYSLIATFIGAGSTEMS